MKDQVLRLASGRQLAYNLIGALKHPRLTILYHHGWPSCALEAELSSAIAKVLGVRFVSFDRPGVGLSDQCTGYSYETVVDDAFQLLDHLGVQRAVMMGVSGGGPYAAACAALRPDRVMGLALVASMTHTCGPASTPLMSGMDLSNRFGYCCINYLPLPTWALLRTGGALLHAAAWPLSQHLGPGSKQQQQQQQQEGNHTGGHGSLSNLVSSSASSTGSTGSLGSTGDPSSPHGAAGPAPLDLRSTHVHKLSHAPGDIRQGQSAHSLSDLAQSTVVRVLGLGLPPADKEVLSQNPQVPGLLLQMMGRVAAQGTQGLWQDMRLTSQPWSFPLSAISCPTWVFQGDADVNVTLGMARYLHNSIPNSSLHVFEGEGHMSLVGRCMRDILEELVVHLP